MDGNFLKILKTLSQNLSSPLYAVGGIVRNYLINGELSTDIDLAGAIPYGELLQVAQSLGFNVVASYPRTGTVVIECYGERFEYTQFRREEYSLGGEHTPTFVEWTDDIRIDAERRDFKCNAVYYDIRTDKIVDPLGGVKDIENRILDTVVAPEKVFLHDGLRLMRLARFAGELNFNPTDEVLQSATLNADNIKDISPERIFEELKKILISDKKYCFSDKCGHYTGLKILDSTGVLDRIIPELTLGRGMAQRADFHNHDVLEHSLRCVLYAHPNVRLSALLHDVGKPFAMINYSKFHSHDVFGKSIARDILNRLKADNKTKKIVEFLVGEHMKDLKLDMRENKIRRYIVKNHHMLDQLFMIKQADFSACKDDLSICPTVEKWKKILDKMQKDGAPLSFSELKITANDLIELGYKGKDIGEMFESLLMHAVINPTDNDRERLLQLAKKLGEK